MRSRKRIVWKNSFWVVFILYFGLISILRWRLDWQVLGMWLGGVLGVMMDYADRLVYVYFTHPEEPLSVAVKRWLQKGQYKLVLIAFKHRGQEQKHLAIHSFLFLLIWVPISLYVITSSGSVLASGLVLGLGLKLLYDILLDFQRQEELKNWLFWQIRRPITDSELKAVVGMFAGAFMIMTWLMI